MAGISPAWAGRYFTANLAEAGILKISA